ncbi:M20 family metallopeptidase [Histidinibacterium aquaticum]|uniref:ArgE/DapE family deacylase n=1 Tax=Histidinibacterium aquaticum TaxID=2613962 RepID=A0A5J5GRX7_9RHOB|nr:ArgE/DapE family deacylase [Histidinibacterium aquaticum]KAA9010338.1 ArgE/DapE family deacylase [Histidinibacterium aquaticum]
MSDTKQAVWDAIDADPDFVTELTQELVRIPSVNPKFETGDGLNRESDVQAILEERLKGLGFDTAQDEVFPNRPNLIADLAGNEDRSLILCGHIDVVPVGARSDWSVDPWGGERKDGRIYGRGAVDMKSGVAACVAAYHFIRKAGLTLDGRFSIHSVVDEEAGGFGAMHAVRQGQLAKGAIVTEPTWGMVQPAEGGLEWVRVTLFGRSGHAGFRYNDIFPQPDVDGRLKPAINAIELANRFLTALRDFEQSRCRNNYHPLCPPGLSTINPGVFHGGVGLGEDGLPQIRSNPAMTPDTAVIDLDYKYLPHEDSFEVRREFEAFVKAFADTDPWMREHPPKVQWELGGLHFPAMDTPVDHPLVQSLIGDHEIIEGKAPPIRGFDAVTDAAHYAGAGVDSVIYGPTGDGFHGIDEYVDIASLLRVTKVVAGAVIDHCGLR